MEEPEETLKRFVIRCITGKQTKSLTYPIKHWPKALSVIRRSVDENRNFEASSHDAGSVGKSYVEVWKREGGKCTMFGVFNLKQPSGNDVDKVIIKFNRITPPDSGEKQPPKVDAFDAPRNAAAGGTCTRCGKEIYGLR